MSELELDPAPAPPDAARLERQLAGAFARADQIRARRRMGKIASAWLAVVAVALLVFFLRPHTAPPPAMLALEGTVIETDGAQSLTLADGTHIDFAARTRADFRSARPENVRIVLDHGEMDLDVAHVEGRTFEVVCGLHTVRVIGTRFHVLVDGPRFSVTVARGRVRVEGPDGNVELGAGETFARGFEVADSGIAIAPAPPPSSVSIAPAPAPRVETAAELFSRAQSARLAGRAAEAARAFDDLRSHHRNDARAGLAAFELGRIRLDDLSDPAGAAEAFQDAVTLSPSASYREDAEARRVEALDATHDARCTNARDAYLARYPSGVFRTAVSKRCSKP